MTYGFAYFIHIISPHKTDNLKLNQFMLQLGYPILLKSIKRKVNKQPSPFLFVYDDDETSKYYLTCLIFPPPPRHLLFLFFNFNKKIMSYS